MGTNWSCSFLTCGFVYNVKTEISLERGLEIQTNVILFDEPTISAIAIILFDPPFSPKNSPDRL